MRAGRLGRLEAALSPTAAVCLWLEEAHGFGFLGSYLAWLIDQPATAGPFIRIPAQVRMDVERAGRGQPRASLEDAVKRAVRDAIFRIALVFELNGATADDTARRMAEQAVLLGLMYFLDTHGDRETPPAGGAPSVDADRVDRLRVNLPKAVAGHLVGLFTAIEARQDLERRYLGGHVALFPDLAADQQRLIDDAPFLAEYARGVATGWSLDRRGRDQDAFPELRLSALRAAARSWVPVEAAARLNDARITAFTLVGDRESAAILAGRVLRSSLHGPPTP